MGRGPGDREAGRGLVGVRAWPGASAVRSSCSSASAPCSWRPWPGPTRASAAAGRASGSWSGWASCLLIALVIVAGSRWLRGLAEPVDDLVAAARQVEAGDYGVQVRERGPREARTLARAFNQMSARLAATERERRGFLADVTHELRTPLAVVRGNTEAIADGVYPADDAHLAPILDATTTPRAAGRRPAHGRPGGGRRPGAAPRDPRRGGAADRCGGRPRGRCSGLAA